ncbi:MAG: UDP-2,3-diacylglucosamine diphosphatase [Pseudomonadota bacterium]
MAPGARSTARINAVFISDLHLGTRDCHAAQLAQFLRQTQMQTLYLVGDIVDLWSMRRGIYWPASHQEVLRLIVEKARNGTRVVYVPGNHDDLARSLCGLLLADVEVHHEFVHTTGEGLRMLVLHGDVFDGAVRFSPVLKATGCALYTVALFISHYVNLTRGLLGLPRWSLATWIKSRVGDAVDYVCRFERAAANEAVRRGFDGIICGHIHRPSVEQIDGVLYCNDGDWVEHCTALIEDRSGELKLWHHRQDQSAVQVTEPLRDAA